MGGVSLRLLQVYLWLICAFHVTIGVGVNCSRSFIETVAGYYGASVELTPQFLTILRPLGAFMFILGGLAAVAALEPIRYRAVGYGFAALFVLRDKNMAVRILQLTRQPSLMIFPPDGRRGERRRANCRIVRPQP